MWFRAWSSSLNIDAQPTTRAIRAKADTPDEINQMFDGIAYGKASDVLLTVENYLGEETFRQGVHNYLAAHKYANATAEDFWGAQTVDQPQAGGQDHGKPGGTAGRAHPHLRRRRPRAKLP